MTVPPGTAGEEAAVQGAVRSNPKPSVALIGALLIAVAVLVIPAAPSAFASAPPAPDCPMLPADNALNTPIDAMPIHARSDAWKASMNSSGSLLHPDFGPSFGDISIPYGMPYEVVGASRPKIPISFYYGGESDPGPYPLGPTTPIEGGFESGGDRHGLMVDRDTCTLYETYDTHYVSPTGSWAGSGAIWDMESNALRPAGWTSADAAGLPILPTILRFDEVEAGEVNHAIRFTAHATDQSYLWPARHHAGSAANPNLPPMGARFRLSADYDISGYSSRAQVVLRAMKKYGLILADNGSDWYFTGDSNQGWDSDLLDEFKGVPASQFEAVDASSQMISPDSGQARQVGGDPMCDARPTSPKSTGYLAEGATTGSLDTWVLVANPSTTETVGACITFFTGSGVAPGPMIELPPQSRRSVRADSFVNDFNVSTIVDGVTGTVAVERAMYTASGSVTGAHVGKASAATAPTWYLPEGASAGGFETWVLVANPGEQSSEVSITYLTGAGGVTGPEFTLAPLQRRSFRVNDTVSTYDVSTRVTASGPGVVAERSTYASGVLQGATASPGTPTPSTEWFLAEGASAGGFETWILVANPDPVRAANVELTYMTSSGPVAGPSVAIAPLQRKSFRVNDTVSTYDVSTRIAGDLPVVAERAMYSNHPALGRGAASGEGVSEAKRDWILVEGATAGGFETWVLVANPDATTPAHVNLTYLTGAGAVPGPSFDLGPGSRRSVRVNATVTTFDVATLIRADRPVVTERSVYAPPGASSDSTAGPGIALT